MELACLAQLERSHRRHDTVMTELLDAARRLAAGRPDEGDREVVREAVDYFERAVTRHFLDEEGSVFPRLSTRRPELAEALAALSAEHPTQIAMHHAVADAARQLEDEAARQTAGKHLLEIAERLASQHQAHVAREDEIFRGAHEALTAQDDSDIVAEMEMRRDRQSGRGEGKGKGEGGGGGGGGGGRRRRASEPPPDARLTRDGARGAAKTARTQRAASPAPTPTAAKAKSKARGTAKPTARGTAKPTARPAAKAKPTARAAAKAKAKAKAPARPAAKPRARR